jgi:choline dehydrogenase-like flavoprotein
MAHLELEAGIFVPSAGTAMQHFQDDSADEVSSTGKCRPKTINWEGSTVPILTLSDELRRQYGLVNFVTGMEAFRLPLPSSIKSFQEIYQSILDHGVANDLITHLAQILSGPAIYGKMRGEELRMVEAYRLTNASETAPNPNSRVTLSNETDQFNCNRVVLNWVLSSIDTYSIRRGYEIIGQEVGRSGLGRLKISSPPQFESEKDYWSQHHHMGTTRMHIDSKKGVVNANCQVHGVSNLFIAGSSVFPTSSSATPTLTIIALAVRLADHIKWKMK